VKIINLTLEDRVKTRTADLAMARERAEVLLAEVNHRVANSLQLVGVLVRMQVRSVTDTAAKDALLETQSRIVFICGRDRRSDGGRLRCAGSTRLPAVRGGATVGAMVKRVGLSLMSLGMLGLGVACSEADPVHDTADTGGAASAGAGSGGTALGGGAGSGGTALGGGAGSGGTALGGGGPGGKGSGGSDATGGGGGSGGSLGGFEFDELYEQMEGLCRSGGHVAVQLDLPGTTITGGVGFIARSSDDVVEGELRHFTLAQQPPGFEVRFTWPASAAGGVQADASGVFLSKARPEYNLCFVGNALVGKDVQGETFHLVASDDVTVANEDGTCSDTKMGGTVAFCAPGEL